MSSTSSLNTKSKHFDDWVRNFKASMEQDPTTTTIELFGIRNKSGTDADFMIQCLNNLFILSDLSKKEKKKVNIFVGQTGDGKSFLCNLMCGTNIFKTGDNLWSETYIPQGAVSADKQSIIIDSIGLCDSEFNDPLLVMKQLVLLNILFPTINGLCLVISGRLTPEKKKDISFLFSNIWRYDENKETFSKNLFIVRNKMSSVGSSNRDSEISYLTQYFATIRIPISKIIFVPVGCNDTSVLNNHLSADLNWKLKMNDVFYGYSQILSNFIEINGVPMIQFLTKLLTDPAVLAILSKFKDYAISYWTK